MSPRDRYEELKFQREMFPNDPEVNSSLHNAARELIRELCAERRAMLRRVSELRKQKIQIFLRTLDPSDN